MNATQQRPAIATELCPALSRDDEIRVKLAAGLKFLSLDTAAMMLGVNFPGWRIERPRGEGVLYLIDPRGWKRMVVREAVE